MIVTKERVAVCCIFYYRERELPQKRKSGTKLALAYAVKKNKKVILI